MRRNSRKIFPLVDLTVAIKKPDTGERLLLLGWHLLRWIEWRIFRITLPTVVTQKFHSSVGHCEREPIRRELLALVERTVGMTADPVIRVEVDRHVIDVCRLAVAGENPRQEIDRVADEQIQTVLLVARHRTPPQRTLIEIDPIKIFNP